MWPVFELVFQCFQFRFVRLVSHNSPLGFAALVETGIALTGQLLHLLMADASGHWPARESRC